MKHSVPAFFAAGLALTVGIGGACSKSDDTGHGGAGPDPAIADVIYEGSASAPALEAMIGATLVDDPALAAKFTWPSTGDKVLPEPPPVFCWKIGGNTALLDSRPDGFAPVGLDDAFVPRERRTSFSGMGASAGARNEGALSSPSPFVNRVASALVRGWLDGVPEAHAQSVSTSGIASFLVISSDQDDELVRVFTTNDEYTPSPDMLAKLRAAPQPIHAIVTNAAFNENRLAEGGGPYAGVRIDFTLE